MALQGSLTGGPDVRPQAAGPCIEQALEFSAVDFVDDSQPANLHPGPLALATAVCRVLFELEQPECVDVREQGAPAGAPEDAPHPEFRWAAASGKSGAPPELLS